MTTFFFPSALKRSGWTGLLMLVLLAPMTASAASAVQHWETENGLKVYFVPSPALPMVDARLVFNAGSARDGDHPGLARLTNTLLRDGAGDWDADTIAERFEGVGAQFGATSERDMAILNLRSLTQPDWLETAVETFVTVVGQPAFSQRGLDRTRRQTLVALQAQQQNPGAIAGRTFFETVYAGHPYAHSPLGTEDGLAGITPAQLKSFHQTYYVARNGILALVGGLDRSQAEALAERIAAALPAGEAAPALPEVAMPEAGQTIRVNFPSEQVHVFMGHPGMARGDADHFPLYVGNHRLGGGGFTSRLMEEVRTQRGLAYSVYSYFSPMAAAGPFLMGVQTQAAQADEAVAVMRRTLEDFVASGLDEDELKAAQSNIVGGFPLRTASNSGILDHVAMMGFYGLPLDYLDTFTDQVEALDPATVNEAFGRRVDPDRLVTVIVGGEG
ncbi:pitrilysin family protein [Ectothiorhodospira sp. PHS-1]|uniref:M16 family metallopeptidase n=1 Tax=Ectothiorhodospira sp. PHS-1 TaxID=519989 RepID=UPI0002DE96A8|nr:pitrilysin family protein [Ectothiorhodospira sp. PHS-1]